MQAEDGEVVEISKTWTELTGYTRGKMKAVTARLNLAVWPRRRRGVRTFARFVLRRIIH